MLRGTIGGVGIAVGLPPLEAMFNGNGTAYAQCAASFPKRFGVFFWGNGVKLDRWVPDHHGRGLDAQPVAAAVRGRPASRTTSTSSSGMNIKSGNERGHHAGIGRHHVGRAACRPAAPEFELRLDLHAAEHRPGGGRA